MNNVPEICISLCGAIVLVAAVLLLSARRGKDYVVTVQREAAQ